MATFQDFLIINIHVGTVVESYPNPKARQPALVLKIDFGDLGIKTSSAQIVQNYRPEDIVGKQILAVTNFGTKNIAGVESEVLVLAVVDPQNGTVLIHPERPVTNGSRLL